MLTKEECSRRRTYESPSLTLFTVHVSSPLLSSGVIERIVVVDPYAGNPGDDPFNY